MIKLATISPYLSSSTATAHCRAQENVHQQHDQEQDAQSDCEPKQPGRMDTVNVTEGGNI